LSNKLYSNIEVVAIDVDGCLTDGIYQISSSGEVSKSFYTRDFYAIEQLLRDGLRVVIITQSHDRVIDQQLRRICDHSDFWKNNQTGSWGALPEESPIRKKFISMIKEKILCVSLAVENKKEFLEFYLETLCLSWENIAYMGDAENDLECIKKAGFSGCPNDAIPSVMDEVMYPSDHKGGRGAVYDFCMYLLRKINEEICNA